MVALRKARGNEARSASVIGYLLLGEATELRGEMMQFFPELKTLFRAVSDTLMQVNSEALDGGSRLLPECAPGGQSRGPITRRPSMMISRRVSPGIRARLRLRNLLEIITLDASMGFLIRSAPGVGVFRFGVGPFAPGPTFLSPAPRLRSSELAFVVPRSGKQGWAASEQRRRIHAGLSFLAPRRPRASG